MRIASLDTMLSFYVAFIYVNRPYYDANRILCMSQFLFKVQQKNRLRQKGLLRRFSPDCYGVQTTKEKMREEKAEMYRKLKGAKRDSKEFEWYFLRYVPGEKNKNNKPPKRKKKRKKKNRKTKKKGLLSRIGLGGKRRKTKKRKTKRKRR